MRRYWYFDTIDHIARRTGFSVSKVTNMLYRLRISLRETLLKEGIDI